MAPMGHFIKRLLLFILLITAPALLFPVVACAGGSDAERPASADLDRYAWLREFHDPSLEAVMAETLRNNLDLERLTVNIESGMAAVDKARAGLRPALDLGVATSIVNGLGTHQPVDNPLGSAFVRFSWDFDVWGAGRTEFMAQAARLKASEEKYSWLKDMSVVLSAKAWFVAVEAGMQVKFAEEQCIQWRQVFDVVKKKNEAGLVALQDVASARTDVDRAQEILFQAQGALGDARRGLEMIMGRYPAGKIDVPLALPSLPADVRQGIPKDILARRGDARSSDALRDAARFNVLGVKKGYYPRVSASAQVIKESRELNTLTNDQAALAVYGVQAKATLYDGGRSRADERLAQAEEKEAGVAYDQLKGNVYKDIETALANEKLLQERSVHLQAVAGEQLRMTQLADKQYAAGMIDQTGLIKSRLRLKEAQAALVHVTAEQLIARVDLYMALGGGER